jgi:hypothetical protein
MLRTRVGGLSPWVLYESRISPRANPMGYIKTHANPMGFYTLNTRIKLILLRIHGLN